MKILETDMKTMSQEWRERFNGHYFLYIFMKGDKGRVSVERWDYAQGSPRTFAAYEDAEREANHLLADKTNGVIGWNVEKIK